MIEIDESLLIRLAGVRAFGRGLHCFEEDRVSDVDTTDKSTTAIVHGSRQYKVRLRHTHRLIEGQCDCSESDGIEFCQHCVAVALALHERQTPAKSLDKRSAMRRIRRYLSKLTHEELAEELLDAVKQDRALRDNLLRKARLASKGLSYLELKKMIDSISPEDYLSEPREVHAYFRGLESIIARIKEIADKLDPLIFLRGVEHAVRRLEPDLESIEDFGWIGEDSIEMLIELHREAMRQLNWTPSDLASYLVDRSLADCWHPFSDAPDLYREQLGEAFHAAVLAEIESRLNELQMDSAGEAADREETGLLLAQLKEGLSAGIEN